MKLAELATGWDQVEHALDDGDGEITPEIAATLEALDLAEKEKVDGYVFFIRALEGQAASYKAVEAELQAKRRTAENRIAWLKARVRDYMEARETTELRGQIFRFALQKSGKPPVDLLCEPNDLPMIYTNVSITADKERLRADLQSGKLPPGLARLGEPTISLRIF